MIGNLNVHMSIKEGNEEVYYRVLEELVTYEHSEPHLLVGYSVYRALIFYCTRRFKFDFPPLIFDHYLLEIAQPPGIRPWCIQVRDRYGEYHIINVNPSRLQRLKKWVCSLIK
jgi:hypothetical protein